MKAINKVYYNLNDPELPAVVEWDMADDFDNIVIPELVTISDLGDKTELTNYVNKVVRDYEKGL